MVVNTYSRFLDQIGNGRMAFKGDAPRKFMPSEPAPASETPSRQERRATERRAIKGGDA
jgi:hypothetical protein